MLRRSVTLKAHQFSAFVNLQRSEQRVLQLLQSVILYSELRSQIHRRHDHCDVSQHQHQPTCTTNSKISD